MEARAMREEVALEPRPVALREIKDYAVLMEMAGSYLCEEIILAKVANGIEKNLEFLKEYISALRKQFVGKPAHEVDITSPYDEILDLVKTLREPDQEDKEKIREGEIGLELKEKTRDLANALQELIEGIEGKTAKYTKADLIVQAFGHLKGLVHTLITTYKLLTRIVACVALLCVVVFVILFATMETEKEVMVKVDEVRSLIETKQVALAKVMEEISRVKQRAEAMESKEGELDREEKIKIMELKLKAHNLSEKKEKIQFEIDEQQKLLDQNLKKIEDMRRKSFLKRLLRME